MLHGTFLYALLQVQDNTPFVLYGCLKIIIPCKVYDDITEYLKYAYIRKFRSRTKFFNDDYVKNFFVLVARSNVKRF